MRKKCLLFALFALPLSGFAQQIGFIERFVLAEDRTQALAELIPGTEEYYYFHCLHYQSAGDAANFKKFMDLWIKRHNYTNGVKEMQNRQALLDFENNPKGAFERIRSELNIQFNHKRVIPGQKSEAPTSFDNAHISTATLSKRANERYKNLQGFTDAGLDQLGGKNLNAERRRHLVSRLKRPDFPGLVDHIVADMTWKGRELQFGSHKIHQLLLKEQLEVLAKQHASVLGNAQYVNTYMSRLGPSEDVNLAVNVQEREAQLNRLWAFVQKLDPVHNSLKAHVLYNRLVHDREQGEYNKERFLEYIKLPRNIHYVEPKYLDRPEHRNRRCNLGQTFTGSRLPPIHSDEALVSDYLMHFLVDAKDYQAYTAYIRDGFLKRLFASTKILNGKGDPEQWASLLSPQEFQTLKDRVDLEFVHNNTRYYGPNEAVEVDLQVKNVKNLTVKVFEINTFNYYRVKGSEIDQGIDLDGLVAASEQSHAYAEAPTRRVLRHFAFPQLKGRGAWVIEFIGNGKSSRAVVQRGRLGILQRTTASGQAFRVIDERNREIKGATIWLDGHEFSADKGEIHIPFSSRSGGAQFLVRSGGFCSRVQTRHLGENYQLSGGIYVDRESLLKYGKAQVVVRPVLTVSGEPMSLAALEEVRLQIHSADREGISASQDVTGVELADDREFVHTFTVPDKLSSLRFTLTAKVHKYSTDQKVDLALSENFTLNGIDTGLNTYDLLVSKVGNNYVVDARGKNGEARAGLPLNLTLVHHWFTEPVQASLQTNPDGRCVLGPLAGIQHFVVKAPNGFTRKARPLVDRSELPGALQGVAGSTLRLPWMWDVDAQTAVSLIDARNTSDWRKSVSVKDGFLEIAGLPGGDYTLVLKPVNHTVRIRVTDGEAKLGHALSAYRALEIRDPAPVQIISLARQEGKITVKLANAGPLTRVHLLASRYLPEYGLFGHLGNSGRPGPGGTLRAAPETRYVSGRTLSDEHRYILERKRATTFPGSMLARPGLLLNPWSLRKTEAEPEQLEGGTVFGRGKGESDAKMKAYGGRGLGSDGLRTVGYSNLDFLTASTLALNLKAENGTISFDADAVAGHTLLRVLAVDPGGTVMRHLVLPENALETRELRLADPMDPRQAFSEQRLVSVLNKGDKIQIDDLSSARIESYENIGDVFRLFQTLSGDATLNEFGFILEWPGLEDAEKQEKYSEYACHELNVFLYNKDRKFFDAVIAPYLKNKMHKTYIDEWLLGDELVRYLKPWKFNRLNTPERILLGQRYAQAGIPRHVKDRHDLIPPNIELYNMLFETASKGSALDSDRSVAGEALHGRRALSEKKKGNLATFEAPRGGNERARLAKGVRKPQANKFAEEGRNRAEEKSDKAADMAFGLISGKLSDAKAAVALDGRSLSRRGQAREFFRKLDQTEEWAENNYWKLPIQQQLASLVGVNAFWNDYAARVAGKPFVSRNIMYAAGNFPEMMLALAVTDLPFEAPEHKTRQEEATLAIEAGGPMILFHKEIKESGVAPDAPPILVSQNFYRADDRYRHENNERFDKYVSEEFLLHVVYGCKIILTNPNSNRQKLSVLLQIPAGAVPVHNGFYTKGRHLTLEPFATQTIEYGFYFPATGSYPHYPVHVARNEKLVAKADAATLKVVEKLSKIDTASWDYVSQNAEPEQVLRYLDDHNIDRLDLGKIAWRMQDKAFFEKTLLKLDARRVYHGTLWSYGIKHQDPDAAREYVKHSGFADRCGLRLASPLLTVDPIERFYHQHLEYSPLVNARAHKVGKERVILNNRLRAQYQHLMQVLKYVHELGDAERLPVAYYLLLQDRVDDGLALFDSVNPGKLPTRLQYDYMKVYTAFYRNQLDEAQSIATPYAKHPVPRWRSKFVNALNQIKEMKTGRAQVADDDDRNQKQGELAATEPGLSFKVEAGNITFDYTNLAGCTVNFYPMDIELLFSRNPFIQDQSERFSFITPDLVRQVKFPKDQKNFSYELPAKYRSSNVMIEVLSGGIRKAQAYYANNLAVQLTPNYGQIRVSKGDDLKPLSKAYVKVYQRTRDGQVKFYKDGYTDFRGRFDYVSLNTNDLNEAGRFAVLVMSEEHGAMIEEAEPPKR